MTYEQKETPGGGIRRVKKSRLGEMGSAKAIGTVCRQDLILIR
jgi:hypothetical protein